MTTPEEKVRAALGEAGIVHSDPEQVDGHREFRSGFPGEHVTPNGREIKWTLFPNGAAKMHHFGPCCQRADILTSLGLSNSDLGSPNGTRAKSGNPSKFFHPADGLLAATLTKAVEDQGRIVAGDGAVLYRYDDGVYRNDGEREVRERVAALLGELYRMAHASTVVDILENREPWLHWADLDTRHLNLPNGLLDWRTGERHPHSPEVRSTTRIPVEWHPAAVCPAISKWLDQVFPCDCGGFPCECRLFIEEVIGYTLLNENPLHKAIMAFGRGRNGKSTFLRLLGALVGEENIASVSPQALDENRFMGAELYGKLANLAGDVDPRTFKATETFKKATGEDFITAERKHAQPFQFKSRAVMIAAFNGLPRTADTTEGFFSKWIVVPFTGYFPDTVADRGLLSRLTTADELQGLLVLAVAGLRRLMARGYFVLPPSVEQATGDFRRAADAVRSFLHEETCKDPEGWEPRKDLYDGYKRWAEENGFSVMSASTFYERVAEAAEDVFGYPLSSRGRQGVRGFRGVKWRGPLDGIDSDDDPGKPDEPAAQGQTPPPEVAEVAEVAAPPFSCAHAHAGVKVGEAATSATSAPGAPAAVKVGNPAPSAPSARVGATWAEPVLITSAEDLRAVLPMLLEADALGLDCETTCLDPFTSDVRLVQIADRPDRACVVDVHHVPVTELQPLLDQAQLIVGHNLKFDLRHLMAAGLTLPPDIGGRLFDTMLASQVLHAGDLARKHALADLTERHLGNRLDKTEQMSDWTGAWSSELTEQQIAYAAADAAVLLPLRDKLTCQLAESDLPQVVRIENHALPAITWMEHAGLNFDRALHAQLAADARKRVTEADRQLVEAAGRRVDWSSPKQVLSLLRSRGHRVDNTADVVLASLAGTDEVARLLQEYREARKLLGLYGPEFARRVSPVTERIHPEFRQMGAAPGRMSCGNPNVQQIPRASGHRRLFCAPEGRVLVWADYSQIELRIVAEIAGDEKLIDAFAAGANIRETTSRLVKVPRSLAKNLNFGLVYGAGVPRFAQMAGLSVADAGNTGPGSSAPAPDCTTGRSSRAWGTPRSPRTRWPAGGA